MDLRIINFPDQNFKNYLIGYFDKDGDGEISLTEALTIENINCYGRGIQSLSGIEHLYNLRLLQCGANNISEMDLTHNTKIESIQCRHNKLQSLNTSNNPLLSALNCSNCSIEYLDLSKNYNLQSVSCYFNPLQSINTDNCINLTTLRTRRCHLSDLNLRSNFLLEELDCRENDLTLLDLSFNTRIKKDCLQTYRHDRSEPIVVMPVTTYK